mgnify:FL=1
MTKREKVILDRVENDIKLAKVRLDSWKCEQSGGYDGLGANAVAIAFEKGYINALASIKFDIKYNQ